MPSPIIGFQSPIPQTKWLRQFWMQVQGKTRTWTIQSPLTLDLNVERTGTQDVAHFSFTIYNLGAQARSDIYLDYYDLAGDLAPGAFQRAITLNAGYASWQSAFGPQNPQAFPTIAHGQIFRAYSTRQGPSWVTLIEGWDTGYDTANVNINVTFEKNVSFNQRVTQLAKAMPSLRSVYISPQINAQVFRGATFTGKPWFILHELAQYANADLFIDLGVLYMVPKGQPVPGLTGGLALVNSNNGLLNTPIKQQYQVTFDMLFEPRLLIGQSLVVQSEEAQVNGTYVVMGVTHHGTISDGVSGDLTTSVTGFVSSAAS